MRRGTTPTLTFTTPFSSAVVAVAYITFTQGSQTVLEKSNEDEGFTIGDNSMTLTLSQEDTLSFAPIGTPNVDIQIRVRLIDGTAAASQIIKTTVGMILKEGVI